MAAPHGLIATAGGLDASTITYDPTHTTQGSATRFSFFIQLVTEYIFHIQKYPHCANRTLRSIPYLTYHLDKCACFVLGVSGITAV